MKISLNWLADYLNMSQSDIERINTDLKVEGFKISEVQNLFEKTNKIEVGRIHQIAPHPDAENLVIIQVDVGEEEMVQIVTGATNCNEGNFAPVVRKNGRIADGKKIKKGRLRGVESFGMLCSLEELGYDPTVVPDSMFDNIYILEEQAFVPGTDIVKAVPELSDIILDIETEKNKGVLEFARQLSSALELEVKSEMDFSETYKMSRVMDVEQTSSPDWLKLRLMKAGIKPTDKLHDAKHYVEYEFGRSMNLLELNEARRESSSSTDNQIELELRVSENGESKKMLVQLSENDSELAEYQMLDRYESLLKSLE